MLDSKSIIVAKYLPFSKCFFFKSNCCYRVYFLKYCNHKANVKYKHAQQCSFTIATLGVANFASLSHIYLIPCFILVPSGSAARSFVTGSLLFATQNSLPLSAFARVLETNDFVRHE